jgi:hypothetical protein
MGMTDFPNGVTSYGMPILAGAGSDCTTTGNVFFVDSGNTKGGDVMGKGKSPSTPFLTVDYAIGQCTANNGDLIFVMPGHAENISAATSWVQDVAGVRIIGLGAEETRPTFTFTATAGSIEMDAADSVIANMVFVAGISAVVTGINMDADNCVVSNCTFKTGATATFDWVQMIDIDAVDYCKVLNCEFMIDEQAGTDQAIRIDDAHFTKVIGNHFTGDFTDAMIVMEGALSEGCLIKDNCGYNSDSTAGRTIRATVASTGQCSNNHFGTAFAGATSATFDPGSMGCNNNTVSGPTDENAVTVPFGPRLEWRIAKHASTAFTGGTPNDHGDHDGTGDPYTIFTVTGDIIIGAFWGVVNTDLAGATATLEVGFVGNTAELIAQDTATDLDDGDIWTEAALGTAVDHVAGGPLASGVGGAQYVVNDGANIIETAGTANITAGQIDYYMIWAPAEPGAHVA